VADALHCEFRPGRSGRKDGAPGVVVREITHFSLASVVARKGQALAASAAAQTAFGTALPPKPACGTISHSSGPGRAIGWRWARRRRAASRFAWVPDLSSARPSSTRAAAACCSKSRAPVCATRWPRASSWTCIHMHSGRAMRQSPRRHTSVCTCGRWRRIPCIDCWSFAPTSGVSGGGCRRRRLPAAAKCGRPCRTRTASSAWTGVRNLP
jgi:hypothetical protein